MTQQEILEKLELDMRLRGLSSGTLKVYRDAVRLFMEHYGRAADQLGEAEFRDYLKYLLDEKKITPTTINVYNSAIRFMFEITLEKDISYKRTARFRREHKLPNVLTKDEVACFLSAIDSVKYRAVFYNVYGSGLRASEIGALRVQDVDSKGMRLFIRQAKNNKDRYTILSQAGLTALREYWRAYRPRSEEGYLFPGDCVAGHMGVAAVEIAFRKFYERSGLKTKASVHTLRHSFASHLLEAGTDIFFIKELLGHSTFKSTSVYLHVAQTKVFKTRSPMDASCIPGGANVHD